MPPFTYVGPPAYYPSLGLEVAPGDSQSFRSAPDDFWLPSASNAAKAAKAAAPDPEPDPTSDAVSEPAADTTSSGS